MMVFFNVYDMLYLFTEKKVADLIVDNEEYIEICLKWIKNGKLFCFFNPFNPGD